MPVRPAVSSVSVSVSKPSLMRGKPVSAMVTRTRIFALRAARELLTAYPDNLHFPLDVAVRVQVGVQVGVADSVAVVMSSREIIERLGGRIWAVIKLFLAQFRMFKEPLPGLMHELDRYGVQR